jgi:hypothetical protein
MALEKFDLLEETTFEKNKGAPMKYFIIPCFTLFFLLRLTHAHSQVNKIEHFFASSPKAEKLFHFFSKELGLPVVWNFQSYGDFASGGVTLGNVAFELVTYKGADITSFNGIALEPAKHMEEFEKELDKLGIGHDSIDNSTVSKDSIGALRGWSTLTPVGLLPQEANLFVCDYKNRQRIAENRKKGADQLKETNGGGLGVTSLIEIVIGETDPSKYEKQWLKLPDVKKDGDLFIFRDGPALRLQEAEKNGISKIVIKVKSLKTAKAFLESRKILGKKNKDSSFILPEATDGLQIELVEK